MKEIRIDWDTYHQEKEDSRNLGYYMAITDIIDWLNSGKNYPEFMQHHSELLHLDQWEKLVSAIVCLTDSIRPNYPIEGEEQ